MKFCLDIQSAVTQTAGVGRYTRELAKHLTCEDGDEITLFYLDFMRKASVPDFPGKKVVPWRIAPGALVQKSWQYLSWPSFDRLAGSADLFHFPNFIIPPLRRGKAVVTIHDLGFIRFPEFCEEQNLNYLSAKIKDTCNRADAIITVSHFTASETSQILRVDPLKIHAVHSGISPDFHPVSSEHYASDIEKLGIKRPYFLMVSTIEPRKNIQFLVELFESLTDFDGQFVLVGRYGWKYEPIMKAINDSSRAHNILHIPNIAPSLLPAVYSAAELLIFPSHYEGFGFPPLESMACETPVISSTGGSLPEALGDAAVLIDSFDLEEWRSTILSTLQDSEKMKSLKEKGKMQAARYSWDRTARETISIYKKVLA